MRVGSGAAASPWTARASAIQAARVPRFTKSILCGEHFDHHGFWVHVIADFNESFFYFYRDKRAKWAKQSFHHDIFEVDPPGWLTEACDDDCDDSSIGVVGGKERPDPEGALGLEESTRIDSGDFHDVVGKTTDSNFV